MRQARHSIRTVADPAGRGVPTVLRCWCKWSQKGVHYRRRESGAQRAVGNDFVSRGADEWRNSSERVIGLIREYSFYHYEEKMINKFHY
jgi:hypothetical protein